MILITNMYGDYYKSVDPNTIRVGGFVFMSEERAILLSHMPCANTIPLSTKACVVRRYFAFIYICIASIEPITYLPLITEMKYGGKICAQFDDFATPPLGTNQESKKCVTKVSLPNIYRNKGISISYISKSLSTYI